MKKLLLIIATIFILFGCSQSNRKAETADEVANAYIEAWFNFDTKTLRKYQYFKPGEDLEKQVFEKMMKIFESNERDVVVAKNLPKPNMRIDEIYDDTFENKTPDEYGISYYLQQYWRPNAVKEIIEDSPEIEGMSEKEALDLLITKAKNYDGEYHDQSHGWISMVKVDDKWYIYYENPLSSMTVLSGFLDDLSELEYSW